MVRHEIPFLDEELSALAQRSGPFRKNVVIESAPGPTVVLDGMKVVNLASCNYLGFATHPKIREAAIDAIRQYGMGVGSARSDIGNTKFHEQLEAKTAEFLHCESSVVVASNSEANIAVLTSLLTDKDAAICDADNHASVFDGVKLSGADCWTYHHLHMDDLRTKLNDAKAKGYRRVVTITAGVFSLWGDIAPLPRILELAQEYGAITMVDDGHATGVIGEDGQGTVSYFGLEGQWDIKTGGYGKALGVVGGFVACDAKLRELIVRKSHFYTHTAPRPTGITAACVAALDLMQTDEGKAALNRMWANTSYFKEGLTALGFRLPVGGQTPLTLMMIDDRELAIRLRDSLLSEGVAVCLRAKGLRAIVTAAHEREDLTRALGAFEAAGRQLKVLGR